VRAYGDALKDNQKVQFKMDAPDLNFFRRHLGRGFCRHLFRVAAANLRRARDYHFAGGRCL